MPVDYAIMHVGLAYSVLEACGGVMCFCKTLLVAQILKLAQPPISDASYHDGSFIEVNSRASSQPGLAIRPLRAQSSILGILQLP